ncbi:MAG: class I SAM-dependent methyltransferase, partial [Hymenobacter sp.]
MLRQAQHDGHFLAKPMHWNAATYTQQHNFVFGYGESVVALLAPQPGEVILDVGCGSGELTQQLAQAGATVVGIDASPEMVARARLQFPALDVRLTDATTLDLPERFDAVFSNAALHWMPEATAVAQRLYQHLRPGGRPARPPGGRPAAGAGTGAGPRPWLRASSAAPRSRIR